jgi:hypothetical protein
VGRRVELADLGEQPGCLVEPLGDLVSQTGIPSPSMRRRIWRSASGWPAASASG